MEMTIVLAMHGSPPSDFPKRQIGELFSLHMRLEWDLVPEEARPKVERRYETLEETMLKWPRTETNDPYYTASYALADALSSVTGHDVIVGFNEFCAPTLHDALDAAVDQGARRVIVVTPMMTPGGEHSEIDIPAAIEQARPRHPDVDFQYAWPFKIDAVAQFLRTHIERYK